MIITNVTAYELLNKRYSIDNVEKIDRYVKRIINSGKYMKKYDYAVLVFIPLKKEEDDIKDKSHIYVINGELYSTVYTNKYSECIRLLINHEKNLKLEQLDIFKV